MVGTARAHRHNVFFKAVVGKVLWTQLWMLRRRPIFSTYFIDPNVSHFIVRRKLINMETYRRFFWIITIICHAIRHRSKEIKRVEQTSHLWLSFLTSHSDAPTSSRIISGKNRGETGPFLNSDFSTAFEWITTKSSEKLSESINFYLKSMKDYR